MTTSKSDARKASKLLRTSKRKTVRGVAASDLAHRQSAADASQPVGSDHSGHFPFPR